MARRKKALSRAEIHEAASWHAKEASISMVITALWLGFLAYWLYYYAARYTIYQNMGIFIALVAAVAVLNKAKEAFTMPHKKGFEAFMKSREKDAAMQGLAWRAAFSVIVGIGWLIFLVIWLFFYAGMYSIYQNIGIFIASILAVAAILGSTWAYWGIKYASRIEARKRTARKRKK